MTRLHGRESYNWLPQFKSWWKSNMQTAYFSHTFFACKNKCQPPSYQHSGLYSFYSLSFFLETSNESGKTSTTLHVLTFLMFCLILQHRLSSFQRFQMNNCTTSSRKPHRKPPNWILSPAHHFFTNTFSFSFRFPRALLPTISHTHLNLPTALAILLKHLFFVLLMIFSQLLTQTKFIFWPCLIYRQRLTPLITPPWATLWCLCMVRLLPVSSQDSRFKIQDNFIISWMRS